jgi:hypothetical protein
MIRRERRRSPSAIFQQKKKKKNKNKNKNINRRSSRVVRGLRGDTCPRTARKHEKNIEKSKRRPEDEKYPQRE